MSAAWAGGSTRAWRKIRAMVLARDGYACRLRIPGICTGRADCVHHTLGRAVTGDNPAFLVASCRPCNLSVGDPQRRSRGSSRRRQRPARKQTAYNRW